MSRVAEAFRKSRVPRSTDGHRASNSGLPDTRPAAPWDFSQPAPAPEPTVVPAPVVMPSDAAPVGERTSTGSLSTSVGDLGLLVQRLFQPGGAAGRLRSVIFSTVGSEGMSGEVCGAAADALAHQTTASVCVVDANFLSPSLDRLFGVTSASGLSTALLEGSGVATCLTRIRQNLWLLPAGSRCVEAVPLLTAEQFRPRLLELLAAFDYVMVDAAGAGIGGDVLTLGPLVGGVVLVIEASTTRREPARRIAGSLRAANINILGSVLTNRTFPIPQSIYRRL